MAYASPLTPNFLGVPGRGSSFSTISRPCWTRRLRTLCTACKANTHYLGTFLASRSLIAQKKTPTGLSLRDECWPWRSSEFRWFHCSSANWTGYFLSLINQFPDSGDEPYLLIIRLTQMVNLFKHYDIWRQTERTGQSVFDGATMRWIHYQKTFKIVSQSIMDE